MPWKECHVMDERLRFVARLLEGEKMAPLCAEFGISRKTGYKIFDRYKDCGVQAFDVVPAPNHGMPPEVLDVSLELGAQRTVVPDRAEAPIDLRGLEDKPAALAERYQLVHQGVRGHGGKMAARARNCKRTASGVTGWAICKDSEWGTCCVGPTVLSGRAAWQGVISAIMWARRLRFRSRTLIAEPGMTQPVDRPQSRGFALVARAHPRTAHVAMVTSTVQRAMRVPRGRASRGWGCPPSCRFRLRLPTNASHRATGAFRGCPPLPK